MTITLLSANHRRQPAATEINRIGGVPIGIDESSWPSYDDQPMTHVLTVDLRELRLQSDARHRALALFVASPHDSQAFEPYSAHVRVVLLSEVELRRGEPKTVPHFEPEDLLRPAALEFAPVDEEVEPEDLFARSFAGGVPVWLGRDEYYARNWKDEEEAASDQRGIGTFVMQFGKELVPMDLGEAGVMYVFTDTAWSQCY